MSPYLGTELPVGLYIVPHRFDGLQRVDDLQAYIGSTVLIQNLF